MKKTCEIVKDLLVPYIDDTCSTESRNFLEEHISECEECRSELEKYRSQEITVDVAENIGSKKPFIYALIPFSLMLKPCTIKNVVIPRANVVA